MATIQDGVKIGLVNYLSLILTVVLYVLTIWIPYLNVGTTIAMCTLPAELAKGNVLNPLFIFDGKFRRNMGEFFILMTLMNGAITFGMLFGGIPGIVISIAWSLATVLFVDKDMSALDCLRESNRLTYGNKARIFGAEFLLGLAIGILAAIIAGLFSIGKIDWLQVIGVIIDIILIVFFIPAMLGVEASIYRQLTTGEFLADKDIKEGLKDIKNDVVGAVKHEAPAAEPAPAPAPEASAAEEAPAKKAPKAKKD